MKIILVEPNASLEPLGLACIASVLKQAGHEVTCLTKYERQNLAQVLASQRFDFLGTGGLSHVYFEVAAIIREARQHNLKVILGGGIVTCEPELMLRDLAPDFAVLGEGEETIVALLDCLSVGGDPQQVAGIAFLKDDSFIKTPARKPVNDLDILPFPAWESLGLSTRLDKQNVQELLFTYYIFEKPRAYPLLASRSCPFSCTFCYHPLGHKYRQRSLDSIMRELALVVPQYRINIINVLDELFAFDVERVYEFCRRLKEFGKTITWALKWTCQLRVDRVTEEMLDVMKDAGCYIISYGFESASLPVLESMKKKIVPDQIHRAIEMTYKKHIGIQGNFIFGDPAETYATARETLEFWRRHAYAAIHYGFIYVIPDSPLYRLAVQRGLITDRLTHIKHNLFLPINLAQMSDDEVLRLRFDLIWYRLRYFPWTKPLSVGQNRVMFRCVRCQHLNDYHDYDISKLNEDMYYVKPGRHFVNLRLYCRECNQIMFVRSRLFRIYLHALLLARNYYTVRFWRRVLKPWIQKWGRKTPRA